MKKSITYIILAIILTSCNVESDINDKSKRNGNWYWITEKDNTNGRWVPKGDRTTIQEGLYKFFDCSGNLHSSGIISNFEKVDTTLYYDSLEYIIKKEFKDENNVIRWVFSDGDLTLKHSTCELESKGQYENGLLVNEHYGYYKNGAVKFHFKRQIDSSVVMRFYEKDGLLREERIEKNRIKEGNGQSWYKNGNRERIVNFKEDKLHGEAKYFYKTGKLETHCYFKYGLITDTFKVYFDDGRLMDLGYYEKGKEQGTYLVYHNNGQVKQRYIYEKGEMEGSQFEYSENGNIVKEAIYKSGVQFSFEEYK